MVDLVLFIGQSNMAGRGEPGDKWSEKAPNPTPLAAYEYKAISCPGELYVLKEPFGVDENNPKGINDVFSDGTRAKTGSMVTAFCNSYYAKTKTAVVGVSASKGGSSIDEWQPEAESGYLKDAIARFHAAKSYLEKNDYSINHIFAIWCQGETDGDNGTSKQDYVMKFNIMWKKLHEVIPDLFLIKIGQCNIEGQYDRYDIIRSAQDIIAAEHNNVHLASDAFYGMRQRGLMKDAFHYYQQGYNICGAEAGRTVAEFYIRKKVSVCLNLFDYNCCKAENRKQYIQSIIDKCASLGGGRVVVPEGTWVSGPIHLRSNIELHLCSNAVISFSNLPEDYLPVVFTRWEGVECFNYSPLIYAKDCENMSITGRGRLVGNGKKWWRWKGLQQKAANELCYAERKGVPAEKRVYGTEEAALRPSFIQFISCKNVVLSDFTIEDGPQWTIHPVYCENVVVKHVNVRTSGPNTDGLNPDSCRNVWIEKCTFETGDDCIAVNSGMNEDGWRVKRPCTDISVLNCKMNGGHGAIVIGSGMSGGVEHIYAADCEIKNTMQGIRIKSMRGRGGYVSDVILENIKINDVTEEAIQVSMVYPYSTVEPKNPVPPVFDGITIRNIRGSAMKEALVLRGLEDSHIKNLILEDIEIKAEMPDIIEYVD